MYSPQLGRFLNPDPLTRDPTILYDNNWFGDQLTMMRSVYGYCDNNPINYTDPSGLQPDVPAHLCSSRTLTNKILNTFCEQTYGNSSAGTVCKSIVKTLGGKDCNALWAKCSHIGRHPSDFGKNAYKICLTMYDAVCV